MKKLFLAMLLFMTLATYLWGKAPAFDPAGNVALVFSANTHGEVEPCG